MFACGDKKPDETESPKETDKTNKPDEPTKPTEATNDKPDVGSTAALPAIDLKPIANAKMAKAKKLNQLGLEKQRAKDFPAAIALYRDALRTDPGHITARYNLATALALAGTKDEAIEILQSFADQKDCPVCAGRLARAQKDGDFNAIKSDEAFVKATAKPSVKKT